MNIVLYCSVCGHALTVEKQGSNSVCEYAYIVPCEVCAAQQGVQTGNNRRAEFWACPQCDDIHGVEVSKCGCGYCR